MRKWIFGLLVALLIGCTPMMPTAIKAPPPDPEPIMNVTIVASYTASDDTPPGTFTQQLTIPNVVTQENDWLLAWYTYGYDGPEVLPFARDLDYGGNIISFTNTVSLNNVPSSRAAVYVRLINAAQAGTHDLTALEFLPDGDPGNPQYKTFHAIVVRDAADQVGGRSAEVIATDSGTDTYDFPSDVETFPFTDWFTLVATDTLGAAPSPTLSLDVSWTPVSSVVLASNHLQTRLYMRTSAPATVPGATITLSHLYTFGYLTTGLYRVGPNVTGTTTYTYGGAGFRNGNNEDIRNADELQNALRAMYRTRRRGEG